MVPDDVAQAPEIPPLDPANFVAIDLFSQEMKANPYELLASWATKPPFYVMVNGRPVVVITRYDDVATAFSNYETFSVTPRPGWGSDQFDYFAGLPTVNTLDPPRHTRMRRLMQPVFIPKRVNAMQSEIEASVEQLINGFVGRDGFDIVKDFAEPLARDTLLATFFQLPRQDWEILTDIFAVAALLPTLPPGSPKPEAYTAAFSRARRYCEDVIAMRRREPKDDLIGTILSNTDGSDFTADELFAVVLVLFAGGFGTIAGGLSLVMLRLCRTPDQLALLRKDMSIIRDAIEECLRIESLGTYVHRFVVRDDVIGGTPVYRGMIAWCSMMSSNYDPKRYPDPLRLDLTRKPSQIATFGSGQHFCIGHFLARTVIRIAVQKLLERFPKLRLADPQAQIEYHGVATDRSAASIPLRFN